MILPDSQSIVHGPLLSLLCKLCDVAMFSGSSRPRAQVVNVQLVFTLNLNFGWPTLAFGQPPAIMNWAAFHSIELLKVNVRDMRSQNPRIRVPVLLPLFQSAAAALTQVIGILNPPGGPGVTFFPRINEYAESIAAQTLVIAGACALDDLSGLQDSERSSDSEELINQGKLHLQQEAKQLPAHIAEYMCSCTMVEASRLEKALQGTLGYIEQYTTESPDPLLEDVASGLAAVRAKVVELENRSQTRHRQMFAPMIVESAGS